ncbi:MAG: hypothetical protein RLZZ546_910 [Bacteroidota bacterium]|jgi:hypothetical protein
MKKLFLFGLLAFGMFSCANNDNETTELKDHDHSLQKRCSAHDVHVQQLAADPSLAIKMEEIERFTDNFLKSADRTLLPDGTIQIPVVVNVLWKTNAQNISDAQIASQITVLNEDFSATNTDYSNIPSAFSGVASGDCNIEFVLVNTVRKQTNKTSWSTNDAMKKTSQGGINPTSPTNTLNIWVCNLGNGILGYAQFPGGPAATDGVVIDNNAFGTVGTVTAPFNKGRTATHEVGHWANLRHIWGDATCGSDLVSDTPTHNTANYGCPAQPHFSTCSGAPREMTMNYMDYSDDACMYMFSAGQKSRMLAVFATGGPRNSFAQ